MSSFCGRAEGSIIVSCSFVPSMGVQQVVAEELAFANGLPAFASSY